MSYGQSLLREILTSKIAGTPLENHRPEWLRGLELDFFYPALNLAFEFQGDQHFVPVFGAQSFQSQVGNDALKRRICRERRVVLVKVEAWELAKLKLRTKIFAALNWYAPISDRKERRAWVKSVFNRGYRRKQHLDQRQAAKDYCATLTRNHNSITAIPKRFTRQRAARASGLS